MEINIDFDGTCVAHAYPHIGADIGAVPVLKELVSKGHRLILFTMRSGHGLLEAEKWFEENGIPLYGSQKNPTQWKWTTSNKSYAHLMIDDSALGCPLKHDEGVSDRPFVDWVRVREILIERVLI